MKIVIFPILVILNIASLRFKDREQLETHHKHINTSDTRNLYIHLIPHSHDDVGWLKTVDEYYNGLSNNIQWASVEYVIDSYIEELLKDPQRKFIQVETAFFKMWWDRQDDNKRQLTRTLVKSGQLEFISGGWCMNDEATPYYEGIIDQMTLGHKFLLETFDVKPTIGWQIDPFGHTSTMAAFSSQMGFNAWFFSRIDYQDKEVRMDAKSLEMIMNEQSPIMSHMMYFGYDAPPTFNFDARRNDAPIVDDPNSDSFNLKQRAEDLVNYFRAQSTHYQGDHLMHTLGEDFEWSNSAIWYKNIDKLMKYIHANEQQFKMKLLYSTPSLYVKAINDQGLTYPTKQDDFFPYADRIHAYWTGYFTSRVSFKGYVKRVGSEWQIYKKFISFMQIKGLTDIDASLQKMEEALAIAQHHDAVAGTAKQHVSDDYFRVLAKAELNLQKHIGGLLNVINNQSLEYVYCNCNSTCELSQQALKSNSTLMLSLIDGKHNNAGGIQKVQLRVPAVELNILDSNNNLIKGDIFCQQSDCELLFTYTIPNNNIYQYFRIKAAEDGYGSAKIVKQFDYEYKDETYIQLNYSRVFQLKYAYYKSDQSAKDPSGAYLFGTVDGNSQHYPYGQVINATISYGQIVSQISIHRTYVTTIIRKYSHQVDIYDIESFIDSIPIDDNQGKEIILLITTGINNNQTFYTDSNGLELQKRIVNFRPTWDLQVHEEAAGNFYPYNGIVMIKDPTGANAAAVVNDRSQGVSVIRDGQIEIMIHRRCLKDDQRGVGEALNETINGKGLTQLMKHNLIFYNSNLKPNIVRQVQYSNDLRPIQFLSIGTDQSLPIMPDLNWQNLFDFHILNEQGSASSQVKVYIQIWQSDEYLVRIQNFQEQGTLTIIPGEQSLVEVTLTGNQNITEWKNKQLKWKYANSDKQNTQSDFELRPLQIRSYLINIDQIQKQQSI